MRTTLRRGTGSVSKAAFAGKGTGKPEKATAVRALFSQRRAVGQRYCRMGNRPTLWGAGSDIDGKRVSVSAVVRGGPERFRAAGLMPDASALAADDEAVPSVRLDTEVGYGLGAPAGLGVVTPYAALGLVGDDTRRWRASVGEPAEHGLTVGGALNW